MKRLEIIVHRAFVENGYISISMFKNQFIKMVILTMQCVSEVSHN